MDGMVREVNVTMIDRGLSLVNADYSQLKINQLLFTDDLAIVANLEEKLS